MGRSRARKSCLQVVRPAENARVTDDRLAVPPRLAPGWSARRWAMVYLL